MTDLQSLPEEELSRNYTQHSGVWMTEAEKIRRMSKANAMKILVEKSAAGNPAARRIMEGFKIGLNPHQSDIAEVGLKETLTSDDITSVTSELMNRTLLAQYATMGSAWGWRQYVPVGPSRPDFRTVYPVVVDGSNSDTPTPTNGIPENAPFPYVSMTDSQYSYSVIKDIIGTKYSWESMINDDLGAMVRLMGAVNNKIIGNFSRYITALHTGAAGPNGSVYTVGNGNIVTSNPVLSESALQTAFNILGDRVGPDGEPIMLGGAVLVVGSQALAAVAKQIQQALYIDRTDGSNIVRSNPTLPAFDIVFNPYVKQIATSNAATSWWLFPSTNAMSRPWAEIAFLQGFEQPRMFKKRSEVEDMAGNLLPNMGAFHNFAQEGAVMWAYGGTVIDPIVTVASNGTGS